MDFRTSVPLPDAAVKLTYDSQILSLGSCFAVNMSAFFEYFQLQNVVNPTGILFHPIALERLLERAALNLKFSESQLVYHNELWHCPEAHSEVSSASKQEVLLRLNNAIDRTREAAQNATHVLITLGTAWVYREKENGAIVANCHKRPQNLFTKELLSPEQVRESLVALHAHLRVLNPDCEIIFTISPVRHVKDGFVENQRSKSALISGLHAFIDRQEKATSYFPAFEIVMDELRDYRFYAQDMIHPNPTALQYIWECFSKSWISSQTQSEMLLVDSIKRALAHKPFNPETAAHKQFVLNLEQKIVDIQTRIPRLRF